MEKIAFKSDGTTETGGKIISALKALGGKNRPVRFGYSSCSFYYINHENCIDLSSILPEGYQLKDINTLELTFPRKMWCWDFDKKHGVEEEVLGIFPNRLSGNKVIGNLCTYKNAEELPIQQPIPQVEKLTISIENLIKELQRFTR